MEPRLASVAQVCLRTDKNGRFQSAAELCGHLEGLHRQFYAGTAEEVVVRFLQDPQKVYKESEMLLELETEPEVFESKSSVLEADQETRIEERDLMTGAADATVDYEPEYLITKRKHNTVIVVMIIIFLILLIAAVFLLNNNVMLFSSCWSQFGNEIFNIQTFRIFHRGFV